MAKRTLQVGIPHPQPNPYSVRYYHLVMWQQGEVICHRTVGVNFSGDFEAEARRQFEIPQDAQILTERVG